MLLMVGKGGEGKSRIGLILRELFGSSMYTGSLQKVETNRFARADLEYKLLLIDDDMKTEALPQTNNIKTLVTLEEIAQMLSISLRSAYNLCNSTTEFRVLRVGGSIRIPKDSFDAWLRAA